MTFGTFTRLRRQHLGLKLRYFAYLAGLSPSYVSLMERDIQPPPSEEAILSVKADYMLALAGKISTARKQAIINEILQAPPV
jgi:transcriptional regulator with XRE-family HTH domain